MKVTNVVYILTLEKSHCTHFMLYVCMHVHVCMHVYMYVYVLYMYVCSMHVHMLCMDARMYIMCITQQIHCVLALTRVIDKTWEQSSCCATTFLRPSCRCCCCCWCLLYIEPYTHNTHDNIESPNTHYTCTVVRL